MIYEYNITNLNIIKILYMSIEPRKCAICEDKLFTKFNDSSKLYYCLPHHPNKSEIINNMKEAENILLEIGTPISIEEQRLMDFYKGIINKKDNEIGELKNKIKELNETIERQNIN